jgi:hypothetical protein
VTEFDRSDERTTDRDQRILIAPSVIITQDPAMPRKFEGLFTAMFFSALALALLQAHLSGHYLIDDDAYIHLRIAKNLIRTGAPYLNIGEPIYTSTSLVWILILAGVGLVFDDLVTATLALNAILTSVVCFFVSVGIRRQSGLSGMRSGVLSALIVVPVLWQSSVGIMETPCALVVLLGALLCLRKRPDVAFVLLGSSVFIRPELAVFVIVALVAGLLRDIRKGLSSRSFVPAFFVMLGVVPFGVIALYYYGTLVPQPMVAKSVVYGLSISESLNQIIHSWLYVGDISFIQAARLILVTLLAVLIPLIYFTLKEEVRRLRADSGEISTSLVLLVGGIVTLVSYACSHSLLHAWYVPLYIIPIISGIALSRTALLSPWRLCGVFLVIGFHGYAWSAAALNHSADPTTTRACEVEGLLTAGRTLKIQAPERRILAPEIGALGFMYEGYIYDAVGLATPEALRFHPLKVPEERRSHSNGAIPPGMVEFFMPDIIVTSDSLSEAFRRTAVANSYTKSSLPSLTSKCISTYLRQGILLRDDSADNR